MLPQNNHNIYSVNINYPGVKEPECAGAATGCLLGFFCKCPATVCIVGCAIGYMFSDWLREPHMINSGGIEVNNRTIILHMLGSLHVNRD